jgi:hypothetical protein
MSKNSKGSIIGLVLAAPIVGIALLMPKQKAVDFLALAYALIVGVYLGFVLLDGRRRELLFEIAAIAAFTPLAFLGLWVSPYFLAAGYFAHGSWDILHHPRLVRTRVFSLWPPLCLVVDWIVAGFIVWRW